jgi:hypothetical protein
VDLRVPLAHASLPTCHRYESAPEQRHESALRCSLFEPINHTGTRHDTADTMTDSDNESSELDLRYDASVDMGYLRLGRTRYRGMVKARHDWWGDDPRIELGFDFDADGRLVGIEFFSMSHIVTPEVLAAARPPEPR